MTPRKTVFAPGVAEILGCTVTELEYCRRNVLPSMPLQWAKRVATLGV